MFTFVDTPGAYPGMDAEERGQSEAIGRNIFEMAQLEVPIITTIIGEGGSGGALAISVGDQVLMLQYSIYSVISPERVAPPSSGKPPTKHKTPPRRWASQPTASRPWAWWTRSSMNPWAVPIATTSRWPLSSNVP